MDEPKKTFVVFEACDSGVRPVAVLHGRDAVEAVGIGNRERKSQDFEILSHDKIQKFWVMVLKGPLSNRYPYSVKYFMAESPLVYGRSDQHSVAGMKSI